MKYMPFLWLYKHSQYTSLPRTVHVHVDLSKYQCSKKYAVWNDVERDTVYRLQYMKEVSTALDNSGLNLNPQKDGTTFFIPVMK